MTVLGRHVRATPYRSADEAWEVIVGLLAPGDEAARDELVSVGGVASSLIASEAVKNDSIVVYGAGPRVQVYCLYDEEAVGGERANEQKLPKSPTDGDWSLSLPCPAEDLLWVTEALAKRSTRVTARKLGEAVDANAGKSEGKVNTAVTVDKEAFFRP
jgi:hypothetical protein